MAEQFAAWGPEHSGARLAELDQAKLSLENMQALHLAGQTSMIPAQTQALQAAAQLHSAQAATAIDAFAANKRWQAGISAIDSADMTPAQYLATVGILGIQAGAPEAGRKAVNTASEISARQTQELAARARAAQEEALAVKNRAERIGALAGTVVDQPSLDRALLIARSQGMDTSQLPTVYNEEAAPLIKQIRDASISAAKKAELQLREIDVTTKAEVRNSNLETSAVRRQLLSAQEDLARAKQAKLEKEGGPKAAFAGSPTPDDLKAAGALLKEANINLEGPDLVSAKAAVASRARALAKSNPALDMDQAMRRALAEAQQRGDFQTPEGGPVDKLLGRTPGSRFIGGGHGPLTPIMTVPEQAKRIPNRYYQTPKGPLKWTKEGWVQE